MDPTEVDTLDFLAHLMVRNSKWEKARPLYEALIRLGGGDTLRWRQALAYTLLMLERPAEALVHLDWCLAQRDEAPSSTLALLRARALWSLGQHSEAQAFLTNPRWATGHDW